MNEGQSPPLFNITFPCCLPTYTCTCLLGDLFQFHYPFHFDVVLNVDKVCLELSEPINNEYVVRSMERGEGEHQLAVRKYLRTVTVLVCVSTLRET